MTPKAALLVATAGYAGYFPIAPGTVGSAVGVALWWLARAAGAGLVADLLAVGTLLVLGAWAASAAERALGVSDPGPVVIDEVMGQWMTLAAAPVSWGTAVAGFLLFRVFDIAKPPPARQLERAHGGWGIMLDDLAAGLYAAAVLQLALRWLPAGWW